MNYVVLEKAKPYFRTRKGKREFVRGYVSRVAVLPTPEQQEQGKTGLMEYLEAVTKMFPKEAKREGREYSSVEEFVLKHGKFYTPKELPKNVLEGKVKDCYMNAWHLATERKDLTYVEGYAASVIPVMHAWCVDKQGNVIDPTWGTGKAYYGVPFTTDYIMKTAMRRKYFGILDNYQEGYPLLKERPKEGVIEKSYHVVMEKATQTGHKAYARSVKGKLQQIKPKGFVRKPIPKRRENVVETVVRSQARRKAVQREEPMPEFDQTTDMLSEATEKLKEQFDIDKKHFEGTISYQEIKSQMDKNLKEIRTENSKIREVSGFMDTDNARSIAANMRNELTVYTKYLAGDSVDLMHKFVSLAETTIENEDLKGIDAKYLSDMCVDSIKKLVHQEIESNRQQFTDHGVRHIVKNILNQKDMLDLLQSSGITVSPKDRLLAIFVMINHDVGYTTPVIRGGGIEGIKATKQHGVYGKKIAEEQKDLWNVDKIFSEEEYNRGLDIIETHDSVDMDTKDPVALTTRIADNLSLFQKEKLPSMFEYVEGAERLLVAMGVAAKKDEKEGFEKYRDQLYKKIDKAKFSPALKRDLKAGCKEISFLTPKFTVGVLAGEISKIGKSDKSLIQVTIKHNKFDETLQKLFDVGQQQVTKLLKDYGETDFSKTEYHLGKYGDKSILELKVEK